jgi:hypothetical protein
MHPLLQAPLLPPTYPPSHSSPLPPPLSLGLGGGEAKGKGRKKGGGRGRGGEVSGGKGGPGFHPAPPFPRPALPHLWAGLPNFGASVVFTARPTQGSEKTIEGSLTFFLQLQIEFFFPQRYYIDPPSSKISELHSLF